MIEIDKDEYCVVESISGNDNASKNPKPTPKRTSLTKTIRFNENEAYLWEIRFQKNRS